MENSILAQNIYDNGNMSLNNNTGAWQIDNGNIDDMNSKQWIEDNPLTIDNYYDRFYYPYIYPTVTYVPEKSKIEQAFKILNVLIKKGVVQVSKVKTFVDVVNDIAEVL